MRWHTLYDQVRSENTHRRDTDTGLGGSIGSSQAGEDNGSRAAHGTEEGLQSFVSESASDYQGFRLRVAVVQTISRDAGEAKRLGRITNRIDGAA